MPIRVAAIYRYPVKSLSAERLDRVTLAAGECLPGDRRFALARASAPFDPKKPEWLPKTNFLTLMRDEVLAQLHTRFDEASGVLTIERHGQTLLHAPLTEPKGRAVADRFFAEFMGERLDGPPRLVEAAGHNFTNASRKPNATTYKYVSIVGLSSIADLERAMEKPVDPMRFRANVYLDGAAAWSEQDWIESEIAIGGARLRVISGITRCAATHVGPATGKRDLDILGTLQRVFGHVKMGVYAEVVSGGEIAVGDAVVWPSVA